MATTSLAQLRRHAIARSLFQPIELREALERLGFVQADPIRAPARAQDLILRHRVAGYRAGDLDRHYPALDVEEDFFVNYGFLPRARQALMHPRVASTRWSPARRRRALAVLDFVRERGEAHPRDVEARFAHGAVVNAWGGSSNATTHLLDAMHYRGMLRVARRERGIRIYAARTDALPVRLRLDAKARAERLDALVDMAVQKYAPLPAATLSVLVRRLRYAAPQWRGGLERALVRARHRLAHASIDGTSWYWPAGEDARAGADAIDGEARLLAPFDPIVWDRARFERFFGWPYRFEAYTPVARRKLGYYALPLLWRDRVVGWGNVALRDGSIAADFGYVAGGPPRERAFKHALDAEIARMRAFLVDGDDA